MARIELKNTIVRFKDGFTGSAQVNDTPAQGETTLEIDTLAGLPGNDTLVPVGARFTVVGDAVTTFTVTDQNGNEKQLITLTGATGGNYTLDFLGAGPTTNILYDALASTVQSQLETLSSIDSGDVAVSGAAGGPYTVEFKGQYANTNVAAMVAADVDLSGTTPTVDVTTPQVGGITWELTFSPALVSGSVPIDDAVITFLPQQIDIKIGDGNITYTENNNYDYELDRGLLDTVREGDQAPVDVNVDFVYEYITTGTSQAITPMDALKQKGGAAGWYSSSTDQCEPYAIDIECEYTPPCGGAEIETTTFPDFRPDSKEVDFGEAAVSVSGRCNAVEPVVTRTAQP